ncbi:hypothetical protein MTO96_007954 [Rhipicephalus appendiculatus]
MDSTVDASGVGQSSLEVSTLTGTSRGDRGEGVSATTLIAVTFCVLAVVMALVLTLLFSSDLELYGDDGDPGGEDDAAKIPTHYPGSGSPPATVTEAPTNTTSPPVPVTSTQTASRPLPPATPSPVGPTSPPCSDYS